MGRLICRHTQQVEHGELHRTLEELAARKPRTPEEFRTIKGVGDKKAADLGPAFLECIAGGGP